ncbi:transporter substrate-binding domain-containing protein [Ectopseudomonas mendocina]|uniref:Transporter substrate-binding domain-containing protein n=1 Tax=Ectopseudomonas mendocina TaxID=300 RepID=A0ABZ2RRD4_ECTME
MFLLLWISFGACAEDWRILGDEKFAPYSYLGQDGRTPQGHDVELVKAVLDEANINYQLQLYPWQRLISLLSKDAATAAFPFVDSPERRSQFELVGPIRYGRTAFIVSCNVNLTDWKSFNDLAPFTIGQVRGYAYEGNFDKAPLSRNTQANNPRQLVSMLLAGRIDVIVGDQAQLMYWIKLENAQHQVRVLPTPLVIMPRYVGFSKKNADSARIFAEALERLRQNGTLEQLHMELQ